MVLSSLLCAVEEEEAQRMRLLASMRPMPFRDGHDGNHSGDAGRYTRHDGY